MNCICMGNSNSVSREETMTYSRAGWKSTPLLPLWANRGESRPSKKRELAGPAIGMPAYRTQDRHTRKRYLGPSAKVTLARLEQEALRLSRSPSDHRAATGQARKRTAASTQVEQWGTLLSLRLSAPRLPGSLVERSRLFGELDAAFSHPLTLVSAAAGSGKTTLLSAWVAASPQVLPRGETKQSTEPRGSEPAFAWLSLDESGHHSGAGPPAQDQAELALPLPDVLHLVDLLAPECIEVSPDALRVGQEYACGLAVTACPREVSFDGWLAPLLLHDEVFDLSFHYHPQDTAAMKRQLARNRAGHASGRRFNRREGRADDPDALVAEEDLSRLLDDLARSRERVAAGGEGVESSSCGMPAVEPTVENPSTSYVSEVRSCMRSPGARPERC
jgi:hypothetical protein